MANATIRIITDTEAVILSKGANEALNGRLAYASDKKKLYVGNGTKFVVATDTDVAIDEAKDYTDTAIDEFGDQVYSKEVIDNKIDPITEDIDAIEEEITNIHDDIGNLYTNDQIDGMLDLKADKADVYTKTEVEGFLNDKADKSTTYTKTEVDDKVKPIYRHCLDFRIEGAKKFGLAEPFFNNSAGKPDSTEVWRYYQSIGNPGNDDHLSAILVNVQTLYWNGLPTGAAALDGCVVINGVGDAATITLKIRYFLNNAISDYTYEMGTVGNPTALCYKPTAVRIN